MGLCCWFVLSSVLTISASLVCYDSCFKDTVDGEVTYRELGVNDTVTVVDKCSSVTCDDGDTCATISFTQQDIVSEKYTCQDDSTDEVICSTVGVEECTIVRCSEDECNSGAHIVPSISLLLVLFYSCWE